MSTADKWKGLERSKCPLCSSINLTLYPGDGTGRCNACGIGGSYGSFFPAPVQSEVPWAIRQQIWEDQQEIMGLRDALEKFK